MPFERPTLKTHIRRAISDIETLLEGADARLRKSFENVIAIIIGGASHVLHGHIFFLSRQIFPDTAEPKFLRRWSGIFRVNPKDPATTKGSIIITGVDTTNLPAETVWRRADGVEFTTDAIATISGASATVEVTASVAGADGNTDASTTFTIVTPVVDIDSTATVDGSGLKDGADAEKNPSLLSRFLLRLRTPPSGGGPNDYVKWAREVSGVTRAWEFPAELGLGTVSVRFMVDDEIDPIPSGSKVAEVQAHIVAAAPVTSVPTTVAPIAVPLDPAITLTPNTAAVQAAVTAELEALLLRDAEPGATLLLSHINEAISLASGETDHELTSPVADVIHTTGEIPTLGTPVYS
ncbi:baseplate J/gp47 family protein [Candidatus Pacearchaeota archaeon]|nr:baseplate J/gp47 family protein [Candidatus Pacearchaeota archaeon]